MRKTNFKSAALHVGAIAILVTFMVADAQAQVAESHQPVQTASQPKDGSRDDFNKRFSLKSPQVVVVNGQKVKYEVPPEMTQEAAESMVVAIASSIGVGASSAGRSVSKSR